MLFFNGISIHNFKEEKMHNRKLKSKNIVLVFLVMALTLLNLQTISIFAKNSEENKITSLTENSMIKDNSNLTDKSVKN
jgi:KWG repeat domain protein